MEHGKTDERKENKRVGSNIESPRVVGSKQAYYIYIYICIIVWQTESRCCSRRTVIQCNTYM